MASLPVMYALCLIVMASCVSEAKAEDSNIFTLVSKSFTKKTTADRDSTQHVKEGRNITFLCSVDWSGNLFVYWYRVDNGNYVAFVQYYLGLCRGEVKEESLVKLHVGNTSCTNNSYELQIRNIDQDYEGGWYCLVKESYSNKYQWRSKYIDLKVDVRDEATTEYTTERTDKGSPSRNTLVPLIGGAAGGVIVLLVLLITGCALYRSKRGSNHPDDGQASTYPNRQPGNAETVVMEENPVYSSSSPGNDDYAQIDCRESASPSHGKGEARVVTTQPNPDDCQAGPDSGDIYAVPDKSKKSAAEEKGEASEVKNQPNLDDRNLNQPGLDSGDTYAVPDKSKKSAAEDVEDVYSQVQKPKK